VVTAASEDQIIIKEDASILSAALEIDQEKGNQTKKAKGFAIVSVRNLIIGAVGVVATAMVTGYAKQVGEATATRSILASRAEQFLLSKEEELVRLLDGLPNDIRAATRSIIERIKKRLANPEHSE
jgi:hypothetical protein